MSEQLQHHGIRGMRWGVRRFQNSDGSLTPAGQKRAETKLAKADKKWEKSNKSIERFGTDKYLDVYNKSADKINAKISDFNSKWAKVNFNDPSLKKYNESYMKAYGKMWDDILKQTVEETVSMNPSGTKRISVSTSEPGAFPRFEIVDVEKKR